MRLYRGFGSALHKDDLRCNACLQTTAFMVPCVSAPNGSIWAWDECPGEDIARWYARHDTTDARGAPRWGRGDGRPEGWRVERQQPTDPQDESTA